jgi:hypothetical protein
MSCTECGAPDQTDHKDNCPTRKIKQIHKPPLGVMPRRIFEAQIIEIRKIRIIEILSAIRRYSFIGKEIPKEWFEEIEQQLTLI